MFSAAPLFSLAVGVGMFEGSNIWVWFCAPLRSLKLRDRHDVPEWHPGGQKRNQAEIHSRQIAAQRFLSH